MDTRTLIDGVMRQTIVLIAQLSTAAGIRAPLAHIADQVFVDLARQIEGQGVRQKVVADMFGMSLRTYQRKMTRLMQSRDDAQRTLWETVLEHVTASEPVSREQVERRFRQEDPRDLAAVLRDLVGSGLIFHTGEGLGSLYRTTTAQERTALSGFERQRVAPDFVWQGVFRHGPVSASELAGHLPYEMPLIEKALAELQSDGRVTAVVTSTADAEPRFVADALAVPLGADQGWEMAVLDHFQAMVRAIGAKLQAGRPGARAEDTVGGATLSFDVCPEHPLRLEVDGLLARVRDDVNALWDRVEAYNAEHPIDPERLEVVDFYFGQGAPVRRNQEDA